MTLVAAGRGHGDYSDPPRRPRITLRGVYGSLLVACQYVPQGLLMVIQAVIEAHDRAPGITEKEIHPLGLECAAHGFGAADLLMFVMTH